MTLTTWITLGLNDLVGAIRERQEAVLKTSPYKAAGASEWAKHEKTLTQSPEKRTA